MKRNYHGHSYFSPFILWGDLATKTLEMMLASAQVIGHRNVPCVSCATRRLQKSRLMSKPCGIGIRGMLKVGNPYSLWLTSA